MKLSIYTQIGRFIKRLTGIKDISLLKKDIHKNIGKLIYHQKYNAKEVVCIMKNMGMKKGSIVCIHASMKEFYNYTDDANTLIEEILKVLTPEGTLMMPAFPDPKKLFDDNYIFDLEKDKTKAGYLAETFRIYPGVKRSINNQHSVCAIGKEAEWLIKDHQHCINCWDENSPWYRMTRKNAIVFTLGLPSWYIGTFDHCVEGILYKEHPYWNSFFNLQHTFKYRDKNGNIGKYSCLASNVECRTREKKLIKYFGKSFKQYKLSNLLIKSFDSKFCLDKMIELGRKGITMYYVPSPKKYKF